MSESEEENAVESNVPEMNYLKPKLNQFYKNRTLAAKRVADFIRAHPEGVYWQDLKAAGMPKWGFDRLLKMGLLTDERIPDPERGPRCYRMLWRAQPIMRSATEDWKSE